MSRGGESAGKRRLTAERNDRKAAKAQRRQQRRSDQSGGPVDQAEAMSRFHHLHELRSNGAISEDDFEAQRRDIFLTLGLEDPTA